MNKRNKVEDSGQYSVLNGASEKNDFYLNLSFVGYIFFNTGYL